MGVHSTQYREQVKSLFTSYKEVAEDSLVLFYIARSGAGQCTQDGSVVKEAVKQLERDRGHSETASTRFHSNSTLWKAPSTHMLMY